MNLLRAMGRWTSPAHVLSSHTVCFSLPMPRFLDGWVYSPCANPSRQVQPPQLVQLLGAVVFFWCWGN